MCCTTTRCVTTRQARTSWQSRNFQTTSSTIRILTWREMPRRGCTHWMLHLHKETQSDLPERPLQHSKLPPKRSHIANCQWENPLPPCRPDRALKSQLPV